jgi:hypothetical protein
MNPTSSSSRASIEVPIQYGTAAGRAAGCLKHAQPWVASREHHRKEQQS